jgi:hypothetical protein
MADSSKYKALPVSDEDCNFANISPPPTFQYKIRRAAGLVVIGIAALLVAGAIGFTLGRHRQQEMPELAWFCKKSFLLDPK